LTLTE